MRIQSFVVMAAVALPLAAHAAEFDFPPRKAGQWEMTTKIAGMANLPAMDAKMCLDATTDQKMMAAGLALSKTACSKQDIAHDGADIVIDSTCKFGAMTTTSHVVISGDFQSAYTMHITSNNVGGPKGMPAQTDMSQEARWTGASCTDGLKPGEMLVHGMKIDATKMMKSMGGG